jgi:tRNA A-37 threonylcarbamoyl transferase component Bud32
MPAGSAVSFLDRLRQCGLLTSEQLAELTHLPEAKDLDPRALARVLLRKGWLTPLQINLVAQGRGQELRVGPYVLLDRLGEGGMGQVYKARHRHLGRVVALKVIRKEKLRSPGAVRRFYREAQAAAHLSHPNIVVAYDADRSGNTHYLAMEYVEGQDLARLVKERGPLPVAAACDYVRQAALGLQHAFERGMVHRDVKPHNLLVTATRDGGAAVKVLDMGLARLEGLTGQELALTQSGAILGTPDFLAPEQALDAHTADTRSDLYSLGCTLYYLLAGRAPFRAGSLTEVLLKHQTEEPAPLEGLRPDVPPGVAAVVRRLMAKKPEDRFQTPAELAGALAPFAAEGGGPVVAAPRPARDEATGEGTWFDSLVPSAGPAPLPRRRTRIAVGYWVAGGGVLLLLVGLAVGLWGLQGRGRGVQPTAASAAQPVPDGEDVVWVEDGLPPGANGRTEGMPGATWLWGEATTQPVFSGHQSLKQGGSGLVQQFFDGVTQPLTVHAGDTLFVHVWLDPRDPPRCVMLQYQDGSWWHHRAYWGEDLGYCEGEADTPRHHRVGALPPPGKWARLEVSAEAVGFAPGAKIGGLSFTQFGGLVYYDRAGIHTRTPPTR